MCHCKTQFTNAAGQFGTDNVLCEITCTCSFCARGMHALPRDEKGCRAKSIRRRRRRKNIERGLLEEGHFVTIVAASATANQRAIQIHTLEPPPLRSEPISARVHSRHEDHLNSQLASGRHPCNFHCSTSKFTFPHSHLGTLSVSHAFTL